MVVFKVNPVGISVVESVYCYPMKRQDIQQKIKEISEKIGKKFRPEKIILFGSYAWGEPSRDSDVDLLIIKETKNTRETAREIDGSIFPRPFPVDLIVYRPDQVREREKTCFFIRDILNKGKVLYAE